MNITKLNFRSVQSTCISCTALKDNVNMENIQSTLSVFEFAQYYFSHTPRCVNLSTVRIIVRAKRSNFSNLKILQIEQHAKSLKNIRVDGQSRRQSPYEKVHKIESRARSESNFKVQNRQGMAIQILDLSLAISCMLNGSLHSMMS